MSKSVTELRKIILPTPKQYPVIVSEKPQEHEIYELLIMQRHTDNCYGFYRLKWPTIFELMVIQDEKIVKEKRQKLEKLPQFGHFRNLNLHVWCELF